MPLLIRYFEAGFKYARANLFEQQKSMVTDEESNDKISPDNPESLCKQFCS